MNEDAFFEAAAMGQATLVQEFIDAGIDVDLRDFDREDTALHLACAKGQKEVIELLVENGADVNVQNNRGATPLHSLVKKRFDLLALWLVRQGADINLEDDKGCSARDFALNWFQEELDEAASGVLPEGASEAQAELEAERARQEQAAKFGTARGTLGAKTLKAATGAQEVMKVYLRNGSYKTVLVSPSDTARTLCGKMAKKLGIEELMGHFDLISTTKDDERRLTPGENIFDVKKKWPLIWKDGKNVTQDHCQFVVVLKRGTPSSAVEKFRAQLR
eukprot:CAMPEP_0168600186 /NCGR_PEP_ID=MMETSP0420-20121227/12612_1 /TAXON_ID=498008 /ORGANISM="Pessonella sp." /LENGTH=275 /DNA_ID=CAMNT_0008638185 /DNA_START=29 /DNA_END=853 /DNA_ORIENTATION=+